MADPAHRFGSRGQADVNRRRVLRAAALAALSAPLAACASGYETSPDPLSPLARHARLDGRAADTIEGAADSDDAEIAAAVSRVRLTHAETLEAEIERANRPTRQESPSSQPASSMDELGDRLESMMTTTRELLAEVASHRAGLLGSIAAGCAAVQALDNRLGEPAGDEITAPRIDSLSEEPIDSLQQALGAEHAAVWMFDFARAFLPDEHTEEIDRAVEAHRQARDACRATLQAAQAAPAPAEPAYIPSESVTGPESALSVVVTAESDTAQAWRGVLDRTEERALRELAFDVLLSSGARTTGWRARSGDTPAAVALIGES